MRFSKFKAVTILLICGISIYLSLPTFFSNTLLFLPSYLRAAPVNLGLDLKGGASILLEVEIGEYLRNHSQQNLDQVLSGFRANGIPYIEAKTNIKGFDIAATSLVDQKEKILSIIRKLIGNRFEYTEDDNTLKVRFDSLVIEGIKKSLMQQSIEIIRRRIDESGTKEIDLQRQGDNYILLQVPGSDNPGKIKRLLGKTAKLSLHIVADGVTIDNLARSPIRSNLKVLEIVDNNQKHKVVLYYRPIITGDMLVDAQVSFNQDMPVVSFKLNNIGAKIFGDVSSKNIGKAIAIVLDDKILSIPVIREPILGGSGIISGNFSVASANELALLLRAGALPAPLKVAEERVIGPSLGIDSIRAGTNAMIIGISLVALFMIVFYGFFGLVANFALIINTFMIIACMSVIGATLTLPGIAGIVLTLGMAVDANVLICERIREELRNGKSNLAAIESGYKIAFSTILDANITTIIAAIILYIMGSGSIKSFAVSLTIGITCSMFTAISLTKIIIAFCHRITKIK
ncbi:MAG: protein translocase subunit SecD [Candidatus Midichloria sp.]|uniref:Protein translocase subunit SecD n=1 Tax=Hyalomma marginatum TaxID=34627 RepID=A0A8S4C0W8_9ACAR|nr:protein translocase subunit SecD [Hyalomma marginatum]CAG7600119.1 protein translocase subunit SecD [Hyalomma marginatum]